jgi:hypothetical protein
MGCGGDCSHDLYKCLIFSVKDNREFANKFEPFVVLQITCMQIYRHEDMCEIIANGYFCDMCERGITLTCEILHNSSVATYRNTVSKNILKT